MNVRQLDLSRRTIAVAAALIGTVSLAIGAHAALNKRVVDAAKASPTQATLAAAAAAAKAFTTAVQTLSDDVKSTC